MPVKNSTKNKNIRKRRESGNNQDKHITKAAERIVKSGVRGILEITRGREVDYSEVISLYLPDDEELNRQRSYIFPRPLKVSIVVAAYETDERRLRDMIESVRGQTYTNYELIIADASRTTKVKDIVVPISKEDGHGQIIYLPLENDDGTAATFNEGIKKASGDIVGLLDHDDILEASALYETVKAMATDTNVDLIYTDEDEITDDLGVYVQPKLKPDLNIELLNTNNYIGHFIAIRRTLLDEVGIFRTEYEGAHDYDLILRLTEKAKVVVHIPKVLYHKRQHAAASTGNPSKRRKNIENGKKVLEEHFRRLGEEYKISTRADYGYYRPDYRIRDFKQLTIIVTSHTFNDNKVISDARKHGINVVHSPGLSWLSSHEISTRYALIAEEASYIPNISAIAEMLGIVKRPKVGAVGTKSVHKNGSVLQNGLVFFENGLVCDAFCDHKKNSKGYMHRDSLTQYMSGICFHLAMIKKEALDMTGGYLLQQPHRYMAMDICLQMRKAGFNVVQDPYIVIEGDTSRPFTQVEENQARLILKERWGSYLRGNDPYYNINFEKGNASFRFKEL